jgi:choline dehydrogenase-like flavoprotein
MWDHIIVGAGSAGCVLADRLSADPAHRVLVLEAGPEDRSPWIHMPKGASKLFADPRHAWHFRTEAQDGVPEEIWLRGKMLGGSSSINGMMYFRGQPADYDGWEALGAKGWGWNEMAPAFRAIEKHELGSDGIRGGDGPLDIQVAPDRSPLTEAFIRAGEQIGLKRVADLNRPEQEGVGYATRTIRNGRRMSAAKAFLHPARNRQNLTVLTGVTVSRLILEGRRVVGVLASTAAGETEYRARETILSAGALASPRLLMMSGIGPAERLRAAGVELVHDSPGIGRHLLEHRLLMMQYALRRPLSQNREFAGWRLARNALRYQLFGKGPLAAGAYEVGAFARVLAESATPDVEILMAPYAIERDARGRITIQRAETFHVFGYPLRSRSEGELSIVSSDPAAPARIRPAYLTHPYDRAVTVAMYRYIGRWLAQSAIGPLIARQTEPAVPLCSDEEIIAAFRNSGNAGYHACGTCRMGDFADAVVDERARVRGIGGLRVVDTSIMPAMVSANTNGPVMAMAWRAAELIRADNTA